MTDTLRWHAARLLLGADIQASDCLDYLTNLLRWRDADGSICVHDGEKISPHTYLNLMDQYHPCYRADDYPALGHSLSREDYQAALQLARRHGLTRLDQRASRFAY
ncbi:MAG: hypothetical protein AB2637_15690 [Candidatus Thiodiazotropha sp.]